VRVCEPFARSVVSNETTYGAVTSGWPITFPSTKSWTAATPLPVSDALMLTVSVPLTVAPLAGDAMATVGGVESGGGGGGLPAARNAASCMTHPEPPVSDAIAEYDPIAVTLRSSATLPSGDVRMRAV